MPLVRGLFSQPSVVAKSRTIVNVGGNGDCGFRSIAAGLIDNFIAFPHLNKTLLSKVLRRHFEYYPRHRPQMVGLATPNQLMDLVLKKVATPELIQSIAYTLRQFAVDEMIENPVKYPGAFVQHNEQTSPAEMRNSQTWIDESSISALAKTLDVPVEVRLITSGKELASPPLKYNSQANHSATNPSIVIELERQHYRPRLLNPDVFKSNVYESKPVLQPVNKAVADCDMPEILRKIAAEEKRTVAEFEGTRDLLTTMVGAGELTKKNLLDLYIKGMGTSDYLKGRVKYVDQEHQSDFFSRAIAQLPSHSPSQMHDDAIVAELVYALARAISVGHMRAEDVFTQMEAQQAGLSTK